MNFKPFRNTKILQYLILALIIIQKGAIKPIFAAEDKNLSNGKSVCYVSEYESNEKRSCKLPFSIKDKLTGEIKTFRGCTTYRYKNKILIY